MAGEACEVPSRQRRRFQGAGRPNVRPSSSTARTISASSPTPHAKPKRRPFTRPSPIRRDRALSVSRRAAAADAAWETERARQDTRSSAGDEPERRRRVDAVQHLVEGAVTAEDVERLDLTGRLARDLGRLAACARQAEAPCPPGSASRTPASLSSSTPEAQGFAMRSLAIGERHTQDGVA